MNVFHIVAKNCLHFVSAGVSSINTAWATKHLDDATELANKMEAKVVKLVELTDEEIETIQALRSGKVKLVLSNSAYSKLLSQMNNNITSNMVTDIPRNENSAGDK